jgi:hypothetical protein
MKRVIIAIAISFFALSYVNAQNNVDINGFARNYTGILYDNGDFSILQNTFNLDFQKTGDKVAFKVNPLLYTYGTDSINFRMRELYLDMYFKSFDLRIGKQQVVWGKADGVFITDIVSPLNLTEFLLPDFDEIRRGVYATKLDYYLGNSTFEVIWIPVLTPTVLPQQGSIWHVQPDFPAPPTFDYSKMNVKASLDNSEIFGKYSLMSSIIDIDLMGAYTWDATPTMHVQKQIEMDSTTHKPVLKGLLITPQHHRLTVAGGSFSSTIKGFVLRGEAAYYWGKYFQTADPAAVDAIVQKDYLNYVVGLDYIKGDWKFSTQFIQKRIFDYQEAIQEDEVQNMMTVLIHGDILRQTLHLELFSYIGLDNFNALIRPKITYDFSDAFSVLLGSNIFTGDEDGMFGKYGDNSMIYTKIKYNF